MSVDLSSSRNTGDVLAQLSQIIAERRHGDPAKSYVAKLYAKGEDGALKKVGEEAAEFIMACKDAVYGGERQKMVSEAADLWFHTLIAMARHDLTASDIVAELARRENVSGLEEKAARTPE